MTGPLATDAEVVALVEQAIGSRVLRAALIAEQLGHATMRGHRPYLHGDSADAVLFRDFVDWCLGDAHARDRLLAAAEQLGVTRTSLLDRLTTALTAAGDH